MRNSFALFAPSRSLREIVFAALAVSLRSPRCVRRSVAKEDEPSIPLRPLPLMLLCVKPRDISVHPLYYYRTLTPDYIHTKY